VIARMANRNEVNRQNVQLRKGPFGEEVIKLVSFAKVAERTCGERRTNFIIDSPATSFGSTMRLG